MPARGMTAHNERPPKPTQLTRCRPHLSDNVVDGDAGAEVIAGNCDADPVGVQPSSEMAERGTVERLPIAAMYKNNDRAFMIAGKEINRIACTGTIRNRTRGMPRAIGGRVARPTGHDRRVLRNPGPVVVFDLVIDSRAQDATTSVASRISALRPWSLPTYASIRGHLLGLDLKICRRSRFHAPPPSCETLRGRFSSAV